ncbi:flagellar motor control protein ZomB [Mycolicibacterium tokaiense]|uniref:Transmembrane protein n=1 Tax=Mycolicibacterium tokaiense TaxID=39695 RepID=A0A378TIS4_9MYCO|nr:flagellar motor control protein ZomB [Mycolicibacterium tokaiense]BBY86044.1 membrane protein [Mycolicibacterium tokaiense]STZ59446.1 transmembrane protein [Mycolicibacterium tokaiense]
MRPSFSGEPRGGLQQLTWSVRISLACSVLTAAALFAWGAWQRRWIADDGLIVLRTVRNLLAGNGPVFNAGERVESNTSTLWTYLNYVGALVGGPVRLEYIALTLAYGLSIIGVVLVMLGTARLYAPGLRGRQALLLPAGVLVYIAIPPARDFATSGLENGLVLSYLGLLWWMLVCWAQAPATAAARGRTAGDATGSWFTAALAAVGGLSVLVRPELALIGGLALVLMLIAARSWRTRALILVAGGLLPVAYQIFRMGYYALIVPGTAVAKDASGAKWGQGWTYLTNFNAPYLLWIPAVVLVGLGIAVVAGRAPRELSVPAGYGRLARAVQRPSVIVAFFVVSGLLQGVYWVRQGGDFMHGRVLLTPLFCLLAPVAVIPVVLRQAGYLLAGATTVLWVGVVGWSVWAANSPGMGSDATKVTYSGIVDERRFYAQATGHAHPLTAADYLDYPRMRAMLVAINNTPDGALLLPSGNYDMWDVVPAVPPPADLTAAQRRNYVGPHTVFFTNMGMTAMNVGLDVRVIDQIGLANPLAAHTQRLENGRIGHDKNLYADWAIAEGPFLKTDEWIPSYIDENWIIQAEAALKCPATEAVLESIRDPLGARRFASNVLNAYLYTQYRINRVPEYELLRCGLPEPALDETPYTGLPATGP